MNYKKMFILVGVILLLLIGYFLQGYLFKKLPIKKLDSEVKVKFEICLNDYEVIIVNTFIEKNKKVFIKVQSVKDGKVSEVTDIVELEDCVVIDNQNWSCGGKIESNIGVTYTTQQYLLNNGKFYYKGTQPNLKNECHPIRFEQLN